MLESFIANLGVVLNINYLLYVIIFLLIILVIFLIIVFHLLRVKSNILKSANSSQQEVLVRLQEIEKTNLELVLDNKEKSSTHQGLLDRISLLEQINGDKDKEIIKLRDKEQLAEQYLVNFSAMMASREESLLDIKKQLAVLEQEKQDLLSKINNVTNNLLNKESELSNTVSSLKANHEKQIRDLNAQHQHNQYLLKQQIEQFSIDLANHQNEKFGEISSQKLHQLLEPFRDQLDVLKQQLEESRQAALKTNQELFRSLDLANIQSANIQRDAQTLTRALKGNNTLFGNWGNYSLQSLFIKFGLRKGIDFIEKVKLKQNTDQDKVIVVDYVINLPENKQLIIDSSIDTTVFARLNDVEDRRQIKSGLDLVVHSVEKRANELSSIDIANLDKINTPSSILLYIPLEGMLYTVMEHKPDLYQKLLDRNICLVSNSNLAPIIAVIANLWKSQLATQQLDNIYAQANQIFSTVQQHSGKLNDLGHFLSSAVKAYNLIATSYNGDDGLLRQLKAFEDLAAISLQQINRVRLIASHPYSEQTVESIAEFEPIKTSIAQLDHLEKQQQNHSESLDSSVSSSTDQPYVLESQAVIIEQQDALPEDDEIENQNSEEIFADYEKLFDPLK